ncbi:MAG TPA: hypothetical protein PLL20_12795 [Phycisphaerae bacterium]|nr:hypothetical protein [Phycisphaerae bacterium]HRR85204.1 hypothetical protein [Phycisphaerae bacterium]
MNHKLLAAAIATVTAMNLTPPSASGATFGDDIAFLKRHTDLIVLADKPGLAKVALVPAWQGRVMTSTTGGDNGPSFGWINRELIASGKILPHMNAFGGEDRFWMGPEGGQFSIFFAKGKKFVFEDWQTPAIFDTEPFKVLREADDKAVFGAEFSLTNYSGTVFTVGVEREVELLTPEAAYERLGLKAAKDVSLVAYASNNKITNKGKEPWKKETGLLSVWILGMFNPTPATTVVVPIKAGPESELGKKVTSDYFGEVPSDRLVVRDDAVFLRADGQYRSKIGISPRRSKAILGSYDADNKVLTIVQFNQPAGVTDYVNSLWKLQDDPYNGDAANSYNDGPPTLGAKPMGPFYELESSSPAAALGPGESLTHTHRTIHLTGPESALDRIAKATLGVSLEEIKTVFRK